MSINIQVRDATPDDLYFVRSSWFRSFWDHEPFRVEGAAGYKDYETHMPAIIKGLLERATCKVAVFTAAPTEVLAWAAYREGTLFWAYTKHPFRKQGLQTNLTRGLGQYTLRPKLPAGRGLVKRMHFNPWPLLRTS